jgi:glycosyltransferase involved in cell wall biosynthesis
MEDKISIIVPVYNIEPYLSNCIESIIHQTYNNYEVILVDDGSTDGCPSICDSYALRYHTIHVIHKKNGGLSDARNVGMSVAQGKYITFIDGDDYIHPLYIETMIKAVQVTGAEIAVVDFKKVYDLYNIKKINAPIKYLHVCTSVEALGEILYQKIHDVSACGILLLTCIARRYPFPKGKYYEDLYTTYHYYLVCKKIVMIPIPLYYYLQRPGSITKIQGDNRFLDLLEATKNLVEACKLNKEIEQAALHKQFSNYCRLMLTVPDLKKEYPIIYKKILATIKSQRLSIIFDKRSRIKNKVAAFSLFWGINGLNLLARLKK